jgi:hypothetical protein
MSQMDLLPRPKVSVLSYGGGLDSWAMLLTAVELGQPPDVCVMADVGYPGDLGEWGSTVRHVNEVVRPFCARHGIEFVMLDGDTYPIRKGKRDEARSLWAWLWGRFNTSHQRGIQIPMSRARFRLCTTIAKAERIDLWLADRFPGAAVEMWIGFEANERDRAERGDANQGKSRQRRNRYPLIELEMCRCRCEQFVRESGYAVPRKSACTYCPYGTKADYRTLQRECPDQFAAIVALEAAKPRTRGGKGFKLSLKGYDSNEAHRLGPDLYRPPTLAEWVDLPDKSRPRPACPVCGAATPATKATGCTFLDGPLAEAA